MAEERANAAPLGLARRHDAQGGPLSAPCSTGRAIRRQPVTRCASRARSCWATGGDNSDSSAGHLSRRRDDGLATRSDAASISWCRPTSAAAAKYDVHRSASAPPSTSFDPVTVPRVTGKFGNAMPFDGVNHFGKLCPMGSSAPCTTSSIATSSGSTASAIPTLVAELGLRRQWLLVYMFLADERRFHAGASRSPSTATPPAPSRSSTRRRRAAARTSGLRVAADAQRHHGAEWTGRGVQGR